MPLIKTIEGVTACWLRYNTAASDDSILKWRLFVSTQEGAMLTDTPDQAVVVTGAEEILLSSLSTTRPVSTGFVRDEHGVVKGNIAIVCQKVEIYKNGPQVRAMFF